MNVGEKDEDVPAFTRELRKSLAKTVFAEVQENAARVINRENLLQLFFIGDKYILLKKPEFYTTYVSRLTATSRFYGVMSVGWMVIAISCVSFFFTNIISDLLSLTLVLLLCLLSYWFFRSSVACQEELVWNIIQAAYLLELEEQRNFERTKQDKSAIA